MYRNKAVHTPHRVLEFRDGSVNRAALFRVDAGNLSWTQQGHAFSSCSRQSVGAHIQPIRQSTPHLPLTRDSRLLSESVHFSSHLECSIAARHVNSQII